MGRHGTLRYIIIWYATVRYGTLRYVTLSYGAVRYGTLCYVTLRYGTVSISQRKNAQWCYVVLVLASMQKTCGGKYTTKFAHRSYPSTPGFGTHPHTTEPFDALRSGPLGHLLLPKKPKKKTARDIYRQKEKRDRGRQGRKDIQRENSEISRRHSSGLRDLHNRKSCYFTRECDIIREPQRVINSRY